MKLKFEGSVSPKGDIQDLQDSEYTHNSLISSIESKYANTDYAYSEQYENLSAETLCDPKMPFALQAHQKFVADFMSSRNTTKGLLVYHGLGSGKTCTAIIAAEAAKSISTDGEYIEGRPTFPRGGYPKVVICCPTNVIHQFKREILGPCTKSVKIKSKVQNYEMAGRNLTTQARELTSLDSALRSKKSEIHRLPVGYAKDSAIKEKNRLDTVFKQKSKKLRADEEKAYKKVNETYEILGHEEFINSLTKDTRENNPLKTPGTILIIDEIHKLVSDPGPTKGIRYKKLLYFIRYHIHPEVKIVVMSATPIFDRPFELALTVNLLRPLVPFPNNREKFDEMFINSKTSEETGEFTVDIKNSNIFSKLCSGHLSYFSGGNPAAYPRVTVSTIYHVMNTEQYDAYKRTLMSEIRKDLNNRIKAKILLELNANVPVKSDGSGIYALSQQKCNIVFPLAETMLTKADDEALKNFSDTISAYGSSVEILQKVSDFSRKFSKIAFMVSEVDGLAFVYSRFNAYGVEAIATILKALGWEDFRDTWQTELVPNNNRFGVWSGDSKSKFGKDYTKKLHAYFKRQDNAKGQYIKVILGTAAIAEGIDFANVRQVHICEPWWNNSRLEQTAARAIRRGSHCRLPLEERHVHVFKHASVFQVFPDVDLDIKEVLDEFKHGGSIRQIQKWSIDQYLLYRSGKKEQLAGLFYDKLKETAIDCKLNAPGNLVRLVEYYEPLPKHVSKYIRYYKNPSNGEMFVADKVLENNYFPLESILTQNTVSPLPLGYGSSSSSTVASEFGGPDGFVTMYLIYMDGKNVVYEKRSNGKYIYDKFDSSLIIKEGIKCYTSDDPIKSDLKLLYEEYQKENEILPRLRELVRKEKLKSLINLFLSSKKGILRNKLERLTKKVKKNMSEKDLIIEEIIEYGISTDKRLLLSMSLESLQELLNDYVPDDPSNSSPTEEF